ncbi:MAG: DUF3800 domain-containing protein [bacterium]|nr:DUF3800 domain-containing protein [bacterium]
MTIKKKFYCYVDESGQDTAGELFVVSVLVLGAQRYELEKALEAIELESGKRKKKWTNTKHKERERYLRSVMRLEGLKNAVFYDVLRGSKEFFAFTANTTAFAVRKRAKKGDEVTVYVDGFTKIEIAKFKKILKPSMKARTFVKMIRRDESSLLIRLADALCGLLRDAQEGSLWAQEFVQLLKNRKITE